VCDLDIREPRHDLGADGGVDGWWDIVTTRFENTAVVKTG
jgi:hypothetical protein